MTELRVVECHCQEFRKMLNWSDYTCSACDMRRIKAMFKREDRVLLQRGALLCLTFILGMLVIGVIFTIRGTP